MTFDIATYSFFFWKGGGPEFFLARVGKLKGRKPIFLEILKGEGERDHFRFQLSTEKKNQFNDRTFFIILTNNPNLKNENLS